MFDHVNWPMLTVTLIVFTVLTITNEIGYRVGLASPGDETEPSRSIFVLDE